LIQIRIKSLIPIVLFLLSVILLSTGCGPGIYSPEAGELAGKLILFHAGSLTVPVDKLTDRFQELNPQVKIQTEAAGSRTTARKVSELNREADLIMSADYQVINALLIPDYADWNIQFARNSMVVTYTEKSAYADKINAENWYQILLQDDTLVGRSNPQADPNGYRTLMVWQLAERFYNYPGLYQLLNQAAPQEYIRPKETDLIPLLQTGDLDYAFSYLSVAVQHNLQYITLPTEINLSDPVFSDFYQTSEVELDGEEPGDLIIRQGEPIIYGVTIPSSSPNTLLAEAFLEFVFSSQGMAILEEQGQIPIQPPLSDQRELLPESLIELIDPFPGDE